MVISLARAATWLMIAAVGLLSLIPGSEMIPIARGLVEHCVAYFIFAAVAPTGYGRRLGYGWLAVAAIAAAALFEAAQFWVPGRTPSINDFAASGLGALLGVTAAVSIRSITRTSRRSSPQAE